MLQFSSVTSGVRLFVTPWTAVCQASLSITNSQSLLKLMSMESVMPSNHLNLCRPLLLPPSIIPSIRVFLNESVQQTCLQNLKSPKSTDWTLKHMGKFLPKFIQTASCFLIGKLCNFLKLEVFWCIYWKGYYSTDKINASKLLRNLKVPACMYFMFMFQLNTSIKVFKKIMSCTI